MSSMTGSTEYNSEWNTSTEISHLCTYVIIFEEKKNHNVTFKTTKCYHYLIYRYGVNSYQEKIFYIIIY